MTRAPDDEVISQPPAGAGDSGGAASVGAVGAAGAADAAGNTEDVELLDDLFDEVAAEELVPVAAPPPPPALASSDEVELDELFELDDAVAAAPPAPPPTPTAPGARAAEPALVDSVDADVDALVAKALGFDTNARVAELEAELAGELVPARAALLLWRIGDLHESQLGDSAGALRAWSTAHRLDRRSGPVRWSLRRELCRRGLWPQLGKLIDAELRELPSEANAAARADLLVERAELLFDRLGDTAGARAACDEARSLAPEHPRALALAEEFARRAGDEVALTALLRRGADATEHAPRRAAILGELARLRARDGAVPEALDLLAEAEHAGAPALSLGRERVRIAERAGDAALIEEERLALVRLLTSAPPDGVDRSRELAAELRALAWGRLSAGDAATATSRLAEAVAHAPGDPLLLGELYEAAVTAGDHRHEAAAAAALAQRSSDGERKVAWEARGITALLAAGRSEEAEEILGAVTTRSPGAWPAVALATREAVRTGAWERLALLWLGAATAAASGAAPVDDGAPDPAWAADLALGAADLYARLGQLEAAEASIRRALAWAPGDVGAVEALARVLERAGRTGEACELREGQLARAKPAAQALLCAEIARLAQLAGRADSLVAALVRWVRLCPEARELPAELDHALAAAGRHGERAERAQTDLACATDPLRRAEHALALAHLLDEHLGRTDDAIVRAREALELGDASGAARGYLHELLWRDGRLEPLAEALEAAARQSGASTERRAAWFTEAADLLARDLHRAPAAEHLYREALELSPNHAVARAGLLAALPRQPSRGRALEEAARVAPPGLARRRALLELGEHHEAHGFFDDAARTFRAAAEGAGASELHASWAALECTLRQRDGAGTPSTIDALTTLAREAQGEAMEGALLEEAAWLALGENQPALAAELFARVMRAVPDSRSAPLGAHLARELGPASGVGARPAAALDPALEAARLRGQAVRELVGAGAVAAAHDARAAAALNGDVASLLLLTDLAGELADPDALLYHRRLELAPQEAREDFALERGWALCGGGHAGDALELLLAEGASSRSIEGLLAVADTARATGDLRTAAAAELELAARLGDRESAVDALREAERLLMATPGLDAEAAIVRRHLDLAGAAPGRAR